MHLIVNRRIGKIIYTGPHEQTAWRVWKRVRADWDTSWYFVGHKAVEYIQKM